MAVILGKRKRRDQLDDQVTGQVNSTDEQLQALFRQHFEAQFRPLKGLLSKETKESTPDLTKSQDSEDSEWTGLSGNDSDGNVQVIEHTAFTGAKRADVPREELKIFMTTKPPNSSFSSTHANNPRPQAPSPSTTPDNDTANLKNDLALQRLLRESHLLAPLPSSSTSSIPFSLTDPTGSSRQEAVSLRLQSLGSKNPLHIQQKMPLTHRKGITAKKREREEKRRKEAKENGIILEVGAGKKVGKDARGGGKGRRERGVGAPSVGSFQGGTLRLSRKDVAEIEGPKRSGSGRGSGRGRVGRR